MGELGVCLGMSGVLHTDELQRGISPVLFLRKLFQLDDAMFCAVAGITSEPQTAVLGLVECFGH